MADEIDITPLSTSKITIETVEGWRARCADIVAHAYSELGDLIKKEIRVGDDVTYLEAEGELRSFFITRNLPTFGEAGSDSWHYFGLSGTRRCDLSSGFRTACVEYRFQYLKERCAGNVFGLVSTAFPVTYILTEQTCDCVSPDREGYMSAAERAKLISLMECWAGEKINWDDCTLPIRRSASSARYRESISEKSNRSMMDIPLFANANLKEQSGDRLFYLCTITGEGK